MNVLSVPPLRLLLPVLAAVMLAGCSTTQSCGDNQDYLTAQERPRLDLPPGVMTIEREAPVVIPPVAPDPAEARPAAALPRLSAAVLRSSQAGADGRSGQRAGQPSRRRSRRSRPDTP